MIHKSLIVGSGKIGAFLDMPDSQEVQTHAHAYQKHSNFELIGFYDTDVEKSESASKLWNAKSFQSLEEAISEGSPEVVSLCSPTIYRKDFYELLKNNNSIKFLWIEKPLSLNQEDLQVVESLIRSKDIKVVVNYPRRYGREFIGLKEKIDSKILGELQQGVMTYTKGFLNNGSHLIQLMTYFFGTPQSFQILDCYEDYSNNDLNLDVRFSFQEGSVTFHSLRESNYSNIEFDFFFSKSRASFKQFGLLYSLNGVRVDPVFDGYKDLEMNNYVDSGMGDSFLNVLDKFVHSDKASLDSEFDVVIKSESILHHVYENRERLGEIIKYGK